MYLQFAKGRRREIKSDQFAIDELGTLEVRSFIKRCSISEHAIPTRRFSHSDSYASLFPLEVAMREYRSGPIHYIQDYDNAVQGFGLAALDVESYSYSDIYCLFLSSSGRHRYDPLVCAHSFAPTPSWRERIVYSTVSSPVTADMGFRRDFVTRYVNRQLNGLGFLIII